MTLEQWRTCDGGCCRRSPLRPTPDGGDCVFRDPGTPERGCRVMVDPSLLATMTEREQAYFDEACAGWPQNAEPKTQTFDESCCWRWEA